MGAQGLFGPLVFVSTWGTQLLVLPIAAASTTATASTLMLTGVGS